MRPFLFAALLWAPFQVSFHSDAVQAKVLVEELAKQSGQALVCDAVVANEPVVADFEAQPLDEVLKKLAEVTAAEWVEKDGVRRLTRSSTLDAKQKREDREKMASVWKRVLAEALKEVEALPPFDEQEADRLADTQRLENMLPEAQAAESAYYSRTNPIARAALTILSEIGANAVAQMEVGQRSAYSDRPTFLQRPLGKKGLAELARLLHAARLIADAKEKARPSYLLGYIQVGPGDPSEYGKAVVGVRRSSELRLAYSIFLVDRQGRNIISSGGIVPDAARSLGPHGGKGPKLELNAETRNCAGILQSAGVKWAAGYARKLADGREIRVLDWQPFTEYDGASPDRGISHLLSDPVVHDPVGMIFGRLIRQTAKYEKRPLLATVPDSALYAMARELYYNRISTQGDLEEYLTQSHVPLAARVPYVEIARGGWLTAKPFLPSVCRAGRFDRVAARTMIQAIQRRGWAEADDGVQYMTKGATLPGIRGIDGILIKHATAQVDPGSVSSALQSPVEFFAALGQGSWKGYLGRTMRLAELPPNLRKIVERWIFWSDRIDLVSMERFLNLRPNGPGPLTGEPTEVYPSGLSGDTPVTLEMFEIPAVIAQSNTGHTFALNLYSLASSEMSSNPDAPAEPGTVKRKYEAFTPAVQRHYSVSLAPAAGKQERRTMVETVPLLGAKPVKRGELPPDYLKILQEEGTRLRGGGGLVGSGTLKPMLIFAPFFSAS